MTKDTLYRLAVVCARHVLFGPILILEFVGHFAGHPFFFSDPRRKYRDGRK